MKLLGLTVILVAVQSVSVAGEFYEVDYNREVEGIPFPDHLIPVGPHLHAWQREYRRRIEDHLFVTNPDIAQYLVMPSFGPESCVSIRSEIPKELKDAYDSIASIPRDRRKYFITVTRAAENLWYSMAENSDDGKTKVVETTRVDREISLELAGAIQWAWGRMLHHTRLPSSALVDGLDGCTYEFSARVGGLRDVSGETWSPQGGLTAEIVSLGDSIAAFANDTDASEEPLINALNAFEAKIPEVEVSPVFVMPPKEGPADPFADPEDQDDNEQNKPE